MNISCTKCEIGKRRKQLVVGRGTLPADILFMGEAPGKSEDVTGVPFIGPSGTLLEQMITEAANNLGIPVPSFYITNTILCRPFVLDQTKDDYGANREPTPTEIFNCTPNVLQIIAQVKPRVTVFVGKVAESNYAQELINNVRIYHPAFLLRHGGKSSPYYMTDIRLLEKAFQMLRGDYVV